MTQESNQGLLHCREILSQLSYEGSLYWYEWCLLLYLNVTYHIITYLLKLLWSKDHRLSLAVIQGISYGFSMSILCPLKFILISQIIFQTYNLDNDLSKHLWNTCFISGIVLSVSHVLLIFSNSNPSKNWPYNYTPILEIGRASQATHVVKNLHANVGDTVHAEDAGEVGLILRLRRFPRGGHATHSNIFAWRIQWTKEQGSLQSIGPQRVGHDWSDLACTHG